MDDDGELFKKPFTNCKYQTERKGCLIHAMVGFPKLCSGYLCGWRKGIGSEEDRPDKRGVVLDSRPTILGTAPVLFVTEKARDSAYVREVTERYVHEHIPVFHVYADGTQNVFLEKGSSVDITTLLLLKGICSTIVYLETS